MKTLESKTAATDAIETVREEFRTLKPGYLLKYVLYREEIGGRSAYSVQVAAYIGESKVCQSTAYDISSEAEAAVEIFERSADGLVTPIILHDVIYDILP